jgi:hypothetical protein
MQGTGPTVRIPKSLIVEATGKAGIGINAINASGASLQVASTTADLGLTVTATTGGCSQFTATGGIVLYNIGYGTATGQQVIVEKGTGLKVYKQYAQTDHDYADVMQIHRTSSGAFATQGHMLYINDSPTNSGSVSGKTIKGMVDGVERIGIDPRVADGASAVAHFFDTKVSLANAGSKVFSWRNAGTELMSLTGLGNLIIGATATHATATKCLAIANGTNPDAHVDDQIIIGSKDASTGGATASLWAECAVEEIGTFTPNYKFKKWINGVEYWEQLQTV